jgi:hypothetical protein
LVAAAVVAVAILLAVAFGTPFGSSNQVTYLLEPLRRAFPELYHRDWLVADTTPYHPVFAYAVAPLFMLDPAGRIAFGIAQLVAQVATYVLIYRFVRALAPRAQLAAYALLAALLALGAGRALAGSYLFAGYLQPSSLATLGWLAALIAYVRDRTLVCGIALAIAGAFHVNFLVLGIGWFALLELVEARGRVRLARLARLLAPSLIVLAAFLPSLVAGEHAHDSELALRVLAFFHAPGHYNPKQIRHYVPSLVGWLALAWGMRGVVGTAACTRALRLATIGTALCVAAVLVASIPPLLATTRLFMWRIAPFAQLASQALAVIGALGLIARVEPRPTLARWQLAAIAVGMVTVVGAAVHKVEGDYPIVLTAACLGALVAVLLAPRLSRGRSAMIAMLAGGITCAALASEQRALVAPAVFAPECDGPDCGLLAWTRSTPVDTLLLVPPYMNWFRLGTRRAIVADIKSPPLYADELVVWYRRLCAMVDVVDSPSAADIEVHWDALAPSQLLAAARHFGADYLVLDKTRSKARVDAPIAYEDPGRVVYTVAP